MNENNNIIVKDVEFEEVPPSEDQYITIKKLIEYLKEYDPELKCEACVKIRKDKTYKVLEFIPASYKRKE